MTYKKTKNNNFDLDWVNRIYFWDCVLIVKMVKQLCARGCFKCAASGKQGWHILPNDKPADDSIINYEFVFDLWPGVKADKFNVRIRHIETS